MALPSPANASCPDFLPACVPDCPVCRRLARPDCRRCACAPPSPPPRRRRPLRWLHIPKCGSTLALTIIRLSCPLEVPAWHAVYMALRGGRLDVRFSHAVRPHASPRRTRCGGQLQLPLAGHRPVASTERALASMFRRPAQRLISAFLDNYHAWGLPAAERRAMKAAAPTIAAFARYPGVAGCMAKMLAGRACAEALEEGEKPAVLARALAVLRSERMAFVGLVERWGTSICLLHHTLGRGSQPIAAEFLRLGHSSNSRREHGVPDLVIGSGVYNESFLDGFVDVLDEQVYAEATHIFEARVAQCTRCNT
ncbi:hypothetical protein AB1Y20_004747 [Prymnesium parvum]|uniref:Uncharacterized protein n=1 Tax=Prymnesium parvum TaxID=97485 RepID=A0AB34IX33_PRYPA